MASDPFARRVFPCSLLASLSVHVLVVALLMSAWRSVTFGPGNSNGYVAGTWGAEAEIFFGTDSPEPEALDSPTDDDQPASAESSNNPNVETLAISGSFHPPDAPDSPPDEDAMQSEELSAETEVLSLSEPLDRSETDTGLTYDSEPGDSSDHVLDAAPPKLASFGERESSRVYTNRGPVAAQGASFFGTVAEGARFVYLVDNSPSMKIGRGKGRSDVSRLIRAFAELQASVDRLSPGQSFYVILFNGQTRRMFDDRSMPPRFFPATPNNKLRLEKWLASVGTGESTDPLPALRLGLEMRPSALFLLSDGVFTIKETAIVEFIDRHNVAAAPIHTIAYEDERSCETMWRIAYATGGDFRFVESPSRVREREQSEGADVRRWSRFRQGER